MRGAPRRNDNRQETEQREVYGVAHDYQCLLSLIFAFGLSHIPVGRKKTSMDAFLSMRKRNLGYTFVCFTEAAGGVEMFP